MKKERIILAFVAICTGLIVASSLFYFYQQKTTPLKTPQEASPAASLTPGKPTLEIESPENESITDRKTTEIKGKSQPKAFIVITTNTDDFTLSASDDGSFNQKIALSDDENLITITAYTENGPSETKDLAITYTQEEF